MRSRKVKSAKSLRKKLPDGMKRPLSSYMEFVKEERPKVLLECGTLSLGEIGKELGRRWKSLDEGAKAVFVERSRQSRLQFNENARESGLSACLSQGTMCASGDSEAPGSISGTESQTGIKIDDLGFARQKGFPWYPALKSGCSPKGNRVFISYFGSGEKGVVSKTD